MDNYNYLNWTIETTTGHIMGSECNQKYSKCKPQEPNVCNVCRFEHELNLKSLPDMVFASNKLVIRHKNGGSISFNALDALKSVGEHSHHMEVAHAKAWKEARSNCEFSKRIVKDHDWTYSPSYSGSVEGPLRIVPTNERLDLEKLKIQEQIFFYKEVYLYEDELDDNGCTKCTVKVRVMPSGIFVVFRHYLRVDYVVIRVTDTRLYYEKEKDYILRESSSRESAIEKLNVEPSIYKNADHVWQFLPLIESKVDKIIPI